MPPLFKSPNYSDILRMTFYCLKGQDRKTIFNRDDQATIAYSQQLPGSRQPGLIAFSTCRAEIQDTLCSSLYMYHQHDTFFTRRMKRVEQCLYSIIMYHPNPVKCQTQGIILGISLVFISHLLFTNFLLSLASSVHIFLRLYP